MRRNSAHVQTQSTLFVESNTSNKLSPVFRDDPLSRENCRWVRRDEETAELFAKHLSPVFQPHDLYSDVIITVIYAKN